MRRPALRPAPVHAAALLLGAAALCPGPGWAVEAAPAPSASPAPPPAAAQLHKVEVRSGPTAQSRRRASTASKIVIEREDVERYGDTQLGDVLRRLPGVTVGGRPGRGGDIRMRGLGGGFTQILIDGERPPAGFAVEQLPPEQVERIEIYRAPTAETGARAVAGTLNIILREPLTKSTHELRVGLGADHGEPQGDFNWTRNLKWGGEKGDDWLGAVSVSGNRNRRFNDINVESLSHTVSTGALRGRSTQLGSSLGDSSSLNASGRLRWKLSDTQSLNLSPMLALARGQSHTALGATGYSRFDAVTGDNASRNRVLRLGVNWQWRPTPEERWELRASLGDARFQNQNARVETLRGLTTRTQDDHNDTQDDTLNLGGKWSLKTSREHQWVTGWEWERGTRVQLRQTLENGLPKAGLEEFGDTLSARTQRVAAYTQDEWSPSKQWSVYAGLRWEQITTQGDGGGVVPASTSQSRVLSPLFHLLWKPEAWPKDQVRLSLTRSYRAPSLNDLIAKPVVNASYPNGANTQTTADRAGNPLLGPELATGLDLSVEHWLPTGGILMVSGFVRHIDGLIRNLLALETVPWDATPRWVSRPRNLDRARSAGVEVEFKARLDEIWEDAPDAWSGLLLRANAALFNSRVDGIPGPNNRLDPQPRGTLNLGLDHRWHWAERRFGGGFNYAFVPGGTVQLTPISQRTDNERRVWDAYLSWNTGEVRDGITWRLSLANLLPRDTLVLSQVESGDVRSSTRDLKRTFSVWNLRAEMRF